MKKLIILFTLVAVLAGTLGGVALAAPPDNKPTENNVKMRSGEGYYIQPDDGGTWNVCEVKSEQVGHVTLTVASSGIGSGESIAVRLYLPFLGTPLVLIDENNAPGPVTFEFAASWWVLSIEANSGDIVSYAYTITYPDSIP